MSRVPLPYTQKVLDLFRNPKNLGKMEDATVTAVAGNPACGDMITFYLKINDQGIIEKASFESYGCAANIATASIVTEMVKGLSLEKAWKDITWKILTESVIQDGDGNIVYNLAQQNMIALRASMRLAWQVPNPKNSEASDVDDSEPRTKIAEHIGI